MSKQINIGIVGLGEHMLRAHVKHLVKIPDVSIVRWFDPNPAAADNEWLQSLPVEGYPIRSSFEEILEDEQVHVVVIGSPDQYHADQLLQCVKAEKSVFCEKPMAVTMDEKEKLRDALFIAKTNSLVITSCHPRRFDPPFVWLKQKLEDVRWVEERFGTITDFDFDFWYHEVTDPWKKDRSLLKDHFGHEIDLYRFLFGSTHKWEAVNDHDGYDKYKVIGSSKDKNFPNFVFTGRRSLSEKIYQETVTIKGTKNALVLQLNTGKGFWMRDCESILFPKIDYDIRFAEVNRNFIAAVRGEEDSYLTHQDMLVNNISSIELCAKEEYFECTTK